MIKEMKRHVLVVFFALLLFSSYFVLAAVPGGSGPDPTQLGNDVNQAAGGVADFFRAAIGSNGSYNGEDFVYFFMFLVLFLFIYSVVESFEFFGDTHIARRGINRFMSIIVSIPITFLAMIAIPDGFFSVILPSYGAMGAAILTVIPFLIVFWFSIKTKNIVMARLVWIIFGLYHFAYYFGLQFGTSNWFPGGFSLPSSVVVENSPGYRWIYGLMAGIGLFMNFFVALFRSSFLHSEIDELRTRSQQAHELADQDLRNRIGSARSDAAAAS